MWEKNYKVFLGASEVDGMQSNAKDEVLENEVKELSPLIELLNYQMGELKSEIVELKKEIGEFKKEVGELKNNKAQQKATLDTIKFLIVIVVVLVTVLIVIIV
jgi:uncharacterized coiled-coil DUF342 family protein